MSKVDAPSAGPDVSRDELEATLRRLAGDLAAPPGGPPPAPAHAPRPHGDGTLRAAAGGPAAEALSAEVLDGLLEAVPDALVVVTSSATRSSSVPSGRPASGSRRGSGATTGWSP